MATEILAVGTTAANSSDVTVTADGLTVALKDAAGTRVSDRARVEIQLKDDAGEYFLVDTLNGSRKPGVFIAAPGTYRFAREAGASCGVFSA
ncbi:hypothetical protein [Devosia sp. Root635]|uniref:hypothetical protein n=1 Tax=Devosia sp. Root635 TaxID=1736575 RepID=UPI0006FA5C60|nr:hypothetical protein [Devosia sp. Root635]KRA42101.1 hypothetical protein ASD80_10260 [Devosia sp. Root635]